jgi:hypothetical protein
MNQVHKENLTHVENANPGRQGLEIEIFGMEGVPAEIIDQHNQQVTQAHFAEEEERARVTGNPIRGLYANGTAPEQKRARVNETLEEIEQRAAKYREDRKNGVLPLPPAVKEIVSNPVCLIFTSGLGSKMLTKCKDTATTPSSLRRTRISIPIALHTAYERRHGSSPRLNTAATRRPPTSAWLRRACGCDTSINR